MNAIERGRSQVRYDKRSSSLTTPNYPLSNAKKKNSFLYYDSKNLRQYLHRSSLYFTSKGQKFISIYILRSSFQKRTLQVMSKLQLVMSPLADR